MATKRKRRAAPKAKPMKINWGIVGFIAVVILAISAWQISAKPQSEAASPNWPTMITRLQASINPLNGDVSANWVDKSTSGYRIDGYRVIITPYNGSPENYDLRPTDAYTNVSKSGVVTSFATIRGVNSVIKATWAKIEVQAMPYHSIYNPNSRNIPATGATASVMLE